MNKIPLFISKLIPSNIRLIKYHKQSGDVCYGVSENAFIVIANSCVNIYKFSEMINITKLKNCVQFDYFNFRHEYSISDPFILSSFPNKNPPSSILEFERDELLLANSALTLANNELSAINRSLKLSNDVLISDKIDLTSAVRKTNIVNNELKEANSKLTAVNGKLTSVNGKLEAELAKLTGELANLRKLHNPELFKQVKAAGVSDKVLNDLIDEIKTIVINSLE